MEIPGLRSVSASTLSRPGRFEISGLGDELPANMIVTEARLFIPVRSEWAQHTMRLVVSHSDNIRSGTRTEVLRWTGDCSMVDITAWLQVDTLRFFWCIKFNILLYHFITLIFQ